MRRMLRDIGFIGLSVVALMKAGPPVVAADHEDDEAWAVYEDWSGRLIRSDRWEGTALRAKPFVNPLEVVREARRGRLRVRYRAEGETDSDSVTNGSGNVLAFARPASIERIAAEFRFRDVFATQCAANPVPTRAAARILLITFNDGSSTGPGDSNGDHGAVVAAERTSDSTDPQGVLRVFGAVRRVGPTGPFTEVGRVNLPTVRVGQRFTLRVAWDRANHRFLFGLDDHPDLAVGYTASDTAPAGVPFAQLQANAQIANCRAGPQSADIDFLVHRVFTNPSAVIP